MGNIFERAGGYDGKTDIWRHKDIKNIFSAGFSEDIKTKRIYFLLVFQRTQRQKEHIFYLVFRGHKDKKNIFSAWFSGDIKTFLLSCVSIISILFLHYGYEYACYSNLEPIVFDTSWRTFHWFTYFLPWALLPYLIHVLYRRMHNNKLGQLIILMGKRSYEIFLFQMIVFGLFPINDYIKIIICFLPLLYFEYHQLKEIFTSKENKEVSNQ